MSAAFKQVSSKNKKRKRRTKKSKSETPLQNIPEIQRDEQRSHLQWMFEYRTDICTSCHGQQPHRHRRRPMLVNNKCFNYSSKGCEEYEAHRRCPNGDKCIYAHGPTERMYHPLIYKTWRCENGTMTECKNGSRCCFAHTDADQRNVEEIFGVNWRSYGNDPHHAFDKVPELDEYEWQEQDRERERRYPGTSWNAKDDDESGTAYDNSYPMLNRNHESTPVNSVLSSPRVAGEREGAWGPPNDESKQASEEGKMNLVEPGRVPVALPVADPDQKVNEFVTWFSKAYKVNEDPKWRPVLARFQENGLVDMQFLCDFYRADEKKFKSEILKGHLGLTVLECKGFVRRLKEYIWPTNVSAWLESVVRLPQYARAFERQSVDDLTVFQDDEIDVEEVLDDAGVTAFGHRMQIKHYLNEWLERVGR